MDFDSVLEEIGEFGKYQLTNYLLICLPVFFGAANSLSYVFTAGIPNYRCFVPECDNDTYPHYDEPWVQHAVPGELDSHGIFVPEQCLHFDTTASNRSVLDDWNSTCPVEKFTEKQIGCTRWVYDNFEKTIVEEWSITCKENQWQLALVGTMHFAGIVVGSAAFGVMADKYGRKIMFVVCIFFMSLTGIGQAIATSYQTFLVFAFLNAVGTSGVYPLAFIIGVEMVGRRKREASGIVLNYFYAIGEAAVALAAWLCRDWRLLQLVVSVPPTLFVLYYWLVPESVRWLLAKKRYNKASRIVRKAAAINGVVLSDTILATFCDSSDSNSDDDNLESEAKDGHKASGEIWVTIKEVCLNKVMMVRGLILFYIWAANAFVYYGLSLNATDLAGNKFLNFALVCLVEIPGYSLAWLAMNKIGRRWSLGGSLLLCGLTCLAGGFVTEGETWALVSLFLLGKMGITASFAIIYVHTAEMLPTIIRSGGVGTMSTVARLGAMVAPFVVLLKPFYKPLPLFLFGGVSFVGGLLALNLPETLRRKLPDTVEEAININSNFEDSLPPKASL